MDFTLCFTCFMLLKINVKNKTEEFLSPNLY